MDPPQPRDRHICNCPLATCHDHRGGLCRKRTSKFSTQLRRLKTRDFSPVATEEYLPWRQPRDRGISADQGWFRPGHSRWSASAADATAGAPAIVYEL